MKIKLILSFFFGLSFLYGQIPVSQTSNYHFYQSSSGLMYIGSLDGLNVYDGFDTKIYRPHTHPMIGSNIQGAFLEDRNGLVWFATYEGLHYHNAHTDSIEAIQFLDEEGSLISTDYRVIHLHRDTIWVQAGNFTCLLDIHSRKLIKKYKTNVPDLYTFEVLINADVTRMFAGGYSGLYELIIHEATNLVEKKKLLDLDIRVIRIFKDQLFLGTFSNGLYRLDLSFIKKEKVYDTNNTINSIYLFNDQLLINIDKEGSFLYNGIDLQFIGEKDRSNLNFTASWLSQDNILWEGIVNKGPRKIDVSMKKFKFISTSNAVTSINVIDDLIYVGLRSKGFMILDRNLEVVGQTFVEGKLSSYHSPSTLVPWKNLNCFYHKGLKCINSNFEILPSIKKSNFQNFANGLVSVNDQLIVGTNSNSLLKANLIKSAIHYDTIFKTDKQLTKIVEFDNAIYASYNDEKIVHLVLNNSELEITDTIDIVGELKYVGPHFHSDSILISTVYGLYAVNSNDYSFRQILDREKMLSQTIYAAHIDRKGYIWCSSNSGILRYDTKTNLVHQFTEFDGVQGNEFNTFAHCQLEDGRILFGGINGLNIFHPDSVTLSNKEVPLVLTDYKINDTPSKAYGSAQGINELSLPYEQRTFSFSFHSIDYKNPEATRVKYKLSGIDKKFVVSENAKGFARYSNLKPGSYTLTIVGSNVDKVWNTSTREIIVTIHPPWWQTWWFRLLSVLSIGFLFFIAIRYYYKQQLAKKDFALKTQALIIEKQNALQAERTRIAGEMHDDLGGGLTTIRFLSQKILKDINDESQKTILQKIVANSQNLVNNMSEIIWAMNSGFDTVDNLIAYSRRYAKEFLEERDIRLNFDVIGERSGIELSGEKRRAVFLVLKEAIHNTVKHANANTFEIKFDLTDDISIVLKDNGVGLPSEIRANGNGLKNMKERIENIGGNISFINGDRGLIIKINISK